MALELAVSKAGSQRKLAALLGKQQGHVWKWINVAGKCPPEMAIPIERETGVAKELLRPDLYPS